MIYLASQSPRRRELLDQIQVKYQSIAVNVDETPQPYETPQDYVSRLALAKAQAGLMTVKAEFPILGADTAIVCDGQLFGKPHDENHAKQMLIKFSGRSHQVITAIALVTASQKKVRINTSNVYFRLLTDVDIQAYIATGESLDKAGGYAIQGLASIFIERIEGSYSGVMGLPLYETATLLAEIDMKIL
ncbi:Maf-like protein [Beggiatoa sp. PS]|nr:Maf-like protein [Beggiatoa sp. PS]